MAKRKKDGSYDLRTKEGREAKAREENYDFTAKFFKIIFGILLLPFKLLFRIIKGLSN